MRVLRPLLTLALMLVAALPAIPGGTVAEAERAFAHDAGVMGVRASFLKWLAPASVGFRDGPVALRDAYEARPATKALLAWGPVVAVTSSSGDLAWTTGPWNWRSDSTKTRAEAWGDFVSVWRHQAGGEWRNIFDMGVGHAEPGGDPPTLDERTLAAPQHAGRSPLATRKSLWQADADFAGRAAKDGIAEALGKFAAGDVIALREGMPRVRGLAAARESLATRESHAQRTSLAQAVAQAGDFGYAYGVYVQPTAAGRDTSWYLHFWHRDEDGWKLALEAVQEGVRRK